MYVGGSTLVVVIIGAFLISKQSSVEIPEEFSAARDQGAIIASRVVSSYRDSLTNLQFIAELDRAHEWDEALRIVRAELNRGDFIRADVIQLSSQLERMARLLTDIQPERARLMATEAISSEVALMSRLLSYNALLVQFFETLQQKFEGSLPNADEAMQALLVKINEEVQAINVFNERFQQAFAEFDRIVGNK